MAPITFEHVTKRFDDAVAVDDLGIDVADGEFLVLVGPSGCGKTTALRMLAGLEEITDGRILIGDRVVNNVAPGARNVAMVFQSYALYPHITVYQNLAFSLRNFNVPKDEIERRVNDAAQILELGDYLKRKPKQLSGGQRQRVALGRAIVREPSAFLMDEPLSNLDAKLRVHMRAEVSRIQRRLGVATLYVTHDQVEAMTMGDRVAVLKDGLLQQCDTPRRMYEKPANVFVAGFIGSPAMNLIEAPIVDGGVAFDGAVVPVDRESLSRAVDKGERTVTLGVRPESFDLSATGTGIAVTVNVVEELGADAFAYGTAKVDGGDVDVIVRVDPRNTPAKGESLHFLPRAGETHIFSAVSGERLSD